MKKGIFVAFLLGSILCMSLASAYYFPSARFISQDLVYTITDFLDPILTALFGPAVSGYTFEVLLLFLIISSIVYFVLGKVDLFQSAAIRWILTIAVPLLSVRFMDYAWLITVFEQYKLLGIILSSIVPFIIFFYFIYNVAGDHGFIRKAGWALFVAIYLGLWSSAYVDEFNSAVYFWTFIVGLVCLFGDNLINRRLRLMKLVKADEGFKERQTANLRQQIHDINLQVRAGTISPKFAASQIREIENHIKEIRRM